MTWGLKRMPGSPLTCQKRPQATTRACMHACHHLYFLMAVHPQGYVSCEPDLLGLEEQPLHVALQAIPAKVRAGGRAAGGAL